ncbi:hypothetical protein [Pseudomonas phage HZ2201]|nr:hypothetical protein [Pseudomonas phage HZ2201]
MASSVGSVDTHLFLPVTEEEVCDADAGYDDSDGHLLSFLMSSWRSTIHLGSGCTRIILVSFLRRLIIWARSWAAS